MKVRTCKSAALNTGVSACPYDREKVVGAIVVPHGYKLASDISGSTLEAACHADRPERVMPIVEFVEYAKNGGEPQVSAVGYGPNQVTDVNLMTDTYTIREYSPELVKSLSKTMNGAYDVYFFDRNNVIYGYNDGTDVLAGFPMSTIYPTATPHPTSGAKASLTVSFCHKDARAALENADFEQLDFNIPTFAYGLTPVKFVAAGTGKYKLVEALGGYDRTAEFGNLLVSGGTSVVVGASTAVSYNSADETLSIPLTEGVTLPSLASPSVLYSSNIKGIEQA